MTKVKWEQTDPMNPPSDLALVEDCPLGQTLGLIQLGWEGKINNLLLCSSGERVKLSANTTWDEAKALLVKRLNLKEPTP